MATGEGGRFDGYAPEKWNPDEKHQDFRALKDRGEKEGRGWKANTRKRRSSELEQLDNERPSVEAVNTAKKIKTSSTVGKESGRSWKLRASARSSSQNKSAPRKSWDEKMKKKAELAAWKKQRDEAREEIREAAKAEKKRRADKKKLKEENSKRTGIVYQKISNPRKLRNMSKKQFRNVVLKTADLDK
jgi:hypothetical protein